MSDLLTMTTVYQVQYTKDDGVIAHVTTYSISGKLLHLLAYKASFYLMAGYLPQVLVDAQLFAKLPAALVHLEIVHVKSEKGSLDMDKELYYTFHGRWFHGPAAHQDVANAVLQHVNMVRFFCTCCTYCAFGCVLSKHPAALAGPAYSARLDHCSSI